MGWVARPELVAASCNAGAFGFLGAAVMSARRSRARDRARARTHRSAVRRQLPHVPAGRRADRRHAHRAQGRGRELRPRTRPKVIARFRDAGIRCVPTVGAVKHAQKMVELGVDMVVVQGGEGGGHTGSVASTVLLPQVLDAVKVPVDRRRWLCGRARPGGGAGLRRVGHRHGHAIPDDQRLSGAGSDQASLHKGVHRRHSRDDQGRRHAAENDPQRGAGARRARGQGADAVAGPVERVAAEAAHRRDHGGNDRHGPKNGAWQRHELRTATDGRHRAGHVPALDDARLSAGRAAGDRASRRAASATCRAAKN